MSTASVSGVLILSGTGMSPPVGSDPPTGGEVWEQEMFELSGVGTATVTGIPTRGFLRSTSGACSFRGRRTEFVVFWSSAPDQGLRIDAVSAGSGRNGPMSDEDFEEFTEFMHQVLREWWDTPDAQAMLCRNRLRDKTRSVSERDAWYRRETLRHRLTSGTVAPSELEALIRESA